jgi:hypothetical protein
MRGEERFGWPKRPLTKLPLAESPLANWPLTNLPLAQFVNIVGQVVNLRPIVNRPTAGPAKLFRRSSQPCSHWIHLDVISDSLKLRLVTHQPIIALILPERPPGQSKHLIALTGRKSLKRLHHLGNLHQRRHQEMNVIRHHNVGVELILPRLPKLDGIYCHTGDFRDAKVERAGACGIENAVHSEERLAGGGCSRKAAVRWETAVQAPRDEDGLADGMIVREPAVSKGSHLETVAGWGKILRKVKRPIANRPQVTNLPHKAASIHSSQQAQQPASKAASRHAAKQAQQPAGMQQSRQGSQQAHQPAAKQLAGKAASRHISRQQKQPAAKTAGSKNSQQLGSLRVNAA